ncbi:WavE lipopolysaccharide synthesis family protein [Nostoc linckia]|uniref:WavE lipopolysaccharide synthesis family protein n=1 Tax=Nostoc linckia TaxID=92942 RepID=UPI001FCF9943|nr:WavE lipopolysaccharide synthesis family protein [Nostoc linckia]
MKSTRHFQTLYSQAAQQLCRAVYESFASFKQLNASYRRGELANKPKPPRYRKKGFKIISYPKQALKLKDGQIRIPLGSQVKVWFKLDSFTLPMPSNLNFEDIKELRILPRNRCFYAEFVYRTNTVASDVFYLLYLIYSMNNNTSALVGEIAKQLSVVVQGPIVGKPNDSFEERLTEQCLKSIRHYLPDAEIILSTWKGSDVSSLNFDILVENEDPGNFIRPDGEPNNINRQIVSTREGLSRVKREYALKIRTDCIFQGTGFLSYFGQYNERLQQFKIFRGRILTCAIYSRDPVKAPLLFHPSDIFYFGFTEDILYLFDIPLAPDYETTSWVEYRSNTFIMHYFWGCKIRYYPEQYLWIKCLNKSGIPIELNWNFDANPLLVFQSELSLINNFIFLDPEQAGVVLPQKILCYGLSYTYNFNKWLNLYQEYCLHKNITLLAYRSFLASFIHNSKAICIKLFTCSGYLIILIATALLKKFYKLFRAY